MSLTPPTISAGRSGATRRTIRGRRPALGPAVRSAIRSATRSACAAAVSVACLAALGCDEVRIDDMSDNARAKALEASDFFPDGKLARHPVAGTVPVNPVPTALTNTRDAGGKPVGGYPFEITKVNLERGKQRYDIYCSVCHGATGHGDGMIVQRGFVKPPSLHEQRLREIGPGHVVEVISNGWGAMYSYSDRVSPEDRWNIAAYVQTLQLSQRVDPSSLSAEERQRGAEIERQLREKIRAQSLGSTGSAQMKPTTQPAAPAAH